ncbi:hypothetical protein HN011_000909, partial [Eciton burchellii]
RLTNIRLSGNRTGTTIEENKTETFATHLFTVFRPNPREIIPEEENKLLSDDITSIILDTTRPFTIKEVRTGLGLKKPEFKENTGYLITNQILQKLPKTGIQYVIQL